jgi:ABC-type transport system involved in cytochrome c biogenesis permease subunit
MNSYMVFSLSYLILTVILLMTWFEAFLPARSNKLREGLLVSTVILQAFSMILRWREAGHAPFANMYESLVAFSFVILLEYLLVVTLAKNTAPGRWVLPISWLMLGFALYLPPISHLAQAGNTILNPILHAPLFPAPDRHPEPLSPALQSIWFQIHVPVFFMSYGAFTLAFGVGCMRLLQSRQKKDATADTLNSLDQQIYLFISLGFVFLTAGIITGAIWAKEAWSRYWSWDPKEVWSLIVWLTYAAYFHLRLKAGWKGERTAWFAIIGFIAVLICYYGVNVAIPAIMKHSQGLHSYGAPPPPP